jgi:hypothetical protein
VPFSSFVHVSTGYVQERQNAALMSIITDAVTSDDMSGLTAFGAPPNLLPAGFGKAAAAFEISARFDVFVAIGPTPNALSGPRVLVRAGVDRALFCQPGDKLAWALA